MGPYMTFKTNLNLKHFPILVPHFLKSRAQVWCLQCRRRGTRSRWQGGSTKYQKEAKRKEREAYRASWHPRRRRGRTRSWSAEGRGDISLDSALRGSRREFTGSNSFIYTTRRTIAGSSLCRWQSQLGVTQHIQLLCCAGKWCDASGK